MGKDILHILPVFACRAGGGNYKYTPAAALQGWPRRGQQYTNLSSGTLIEGGLQIIRYFRLVVFSFFSFLILGWGQVLNPGRIPQLLQDLRLKLTNALTSKLQK